MMCGVDVHRLPTRACCWWWWWWWSSRHATSHSLAAGGKAALEIVRSQQWLRRRLRLRLRRPRLGVLVEKLLELRCLLFPHLLWHRRHGTAAADDAWRERRTNLLVIVIWKRLAQHHQHLHDFPPDSTRISIRISVSININITVDVDVNSVCAARNQNVEPDELLARQSHSDSLVHARPQHGLKSLFRLSWRRLELHQVSSSLPHRLGSQGLRLRLRLRLRLDGTSWVVVAVFDVAGVGIDARQDRGKGG